MHLAPVCDNDDQGNNQDNETPVCDTSPNDSPLPLPISDPSQNNLAQTSECNNDGEGSSTTQPKERKQNKFQWFWKFGRNTVEAISEKVGGGAAEATKSANSVSNQSNSSPSASPAADGHCSSVSCRGDSVDQNVMGTLKNIGQSMLDHIQVTFFLATTVFND
jgi:TBC1 domain family protein 5